MNDRLGVVAADAQRLASCALEVIRRAYPHKLDHMILDATDQPLPCDIHPVFDGCYDWHSSVHMHWSLLRLMRIAPALPLRDAVVAHFESRFTPELVARELAYAAAPGRAGFERPYGWAWLLKLQAELEVHADTAAWAQALRPLSTFVAQRLAAFLGASHYPVRAGTHANSAFAMKLALDYAAACGDSALRAATVGAGKKWFGADAAYPAAYEPTGTDFLSPGLCEALLMNQLLGADFRAWWDRFAPPPDGMARWLTPAIVSDRLDAQLVHLDGLNLSRAWCLSALAPVLPGHADELSTAADRHWDAAWPHITGGDFAATHWLLSFALLSVDGASPADG